MTATAKIPPKPGKETVYVDVDDEITSIIDKVDGAKEKIVALVLPKRATVLQSIVNMRLLKRNAEKAGKSVVLITNEEALLPLAGAAGLHVAGNLQSKPIVPAAPITVTTNKAASTELAEDIDSAEEEPSTKLDYHRSVGELAAAGALDEAIDLDDEDGEDQPADKSKAGKTKAPKDKKLKIPNFDRFRLLLIGGIGLLILLGVFIYLAIFVLPKATITVTTGSTPVSANLNVNASDSYKTLDEKNNNIPAQLKTTTQTQTETVPATGQQNNGQKASGTVTMDDCVAGFSGPSSVPAGTGVSANGLTYIIQQNTKFSNSGTPTGSCIDYQASNPTSIVAQAGGTKYNVASGTSFTVSGRSDVNASGSASGGTDNNVTVVSQADLDNAASKETADATATFTKNFTTSLTNQGLYVFTSTLKPGTPTTTASPVLGQPASSTTVTTVTTYTVLVVKKSDFSKLLTDDLNKQIDPKKQKLTSTNVLADATISVQSQGSPSSGVISVTIDTTAIPIIDENSVKQEAVGQKVGDIKSAVSGIPGVEKVDVKLSPFWISKAPKANKITVVQKQVKGSGG